ncbi:GNAT family N-acetyltransferase [Pseudooctadecabacter jejudonensis]|uniref:Acetyltransferase (GNAT) family protein n=1 Tax=Pseudooctadecabacter jejudonensis TaxID=1391910 RepID=A0A1Y5RSI9_9RHOB|nr:GNAT family N-acetyltransferase [Pseudooctadecabacter jejudonensis]SLN23364.1 Acetyltransferase (GNAT) family protein [Pseudooctadecabacter jejudonensis]
MPLPDLTVRCAKPSDLPDILSMIKALSAFHGDTASVTLSALQEIFFGPADQGHALIACQHGTPLGYAGLTPTTVLHEGKIRLDIHHLYVSEPARSQGVGTALIAAAKRHAIASGATRLTIGTDPGNATAIAAYRAMPALSEITGAGPRFAINLGAP